MKNRNALFTIFVAGIVFLAACSPQTTATPEIMMDKPTEAMLEKPTGIMMEKTEAPMMDETEAPMMDETKPVGMQEAESTTSAETMMKDAPAWFSIPLTDVNTGSQFSISDFKGKVVLFEAMAVWCSNCKSQQGEVLKLKQELGDKVVYVGVDIDPNEDMDKLKVFITANNFDWVYSVAPTELSSELATLYGNQFLNPPSTPMLIIDSKGEVHLLPFGIKSAEQLKEFVTPFLGM
jgi:thiol-disulfide isomerase/thioredoxin